MKKVSDDIDVPGFGRVHQRSRPARVETVDRVTAFLNQIFNSFLNCKKNIVKFVTSHYIYYAT